MFTIRYATEADCPALANINVKAFGSSPFLANIFPGASLESMMPFKADRALKRLVDPTTHVLVTTDHETDSVVGYCRWIIPQGIGYDTEPVSLSDDGKVALEDPMRFAPGPMNEEIQNAFKRLLEEKRKQYTTEDDFILDFVATLPNYQGNGIGSGFLRWGLEKADALQRRVYLEATTEGYPLYCKYGWKTVGEATIDFTQYGGQGSQTFSLMIRDPHI